MDWQANFIRYVMFVPVAMNENAGQLFFNVTGQFPQQMQQQAPVGQTAGGPVDGLWASVTTQPGRIQLDITPPPPTDMSGAFGGFASFRPLSDIKKAIKTARGLLAKLVDGKLINRVAFVVDAVQPMATADASRARLSELLPFLDLPQRSIEVTFQLNSPVPAKLDGNDINRLCRWGSVTLHVLQMEMGGAAPNFLEVGHAAALMIDVNTSGNRALPFEAGQIDALYSELENHAVAVLDNGYDALR